MKKWFTIHLPWRKDKLGTVLESMCPLGHAQVNFYLAVLESPLGPFTWRWEARISPQGIASAEILCPVSLVFPGSELLPWWAVCAQSLQSCPTL